MKSQIRTHEEIDWMTGFQLGMGIESPSVQLIGTAVKPFKVKEQKTKTTEEKVEIIDSEEKVHKALDIAASASFNTLNAQGSFSTKWHSEISFSHKSFTFLLGSEIKWQPTICAPTEIELNEEAQSKLKKSRSSFRDAYGDYFIAGYQKTARFYALYKCEAREEKSINEFKAEANFSYDVFSAKGSVGFLNTAEDNDVNISCVIFQEGIKQEGIKEEEKNGTTMKMDPGKISEEFERFKKNAVGVPSRAILYHYCLLNPEIPATIDVNPDNLVDAQELYRKLISAEARVADIPRNYKRDLMDGLEKCRNNIYTRIPPDLKCENDLIKKWINETDKWIDNCDDIFSYYTLWRELKSQKRGITSGNNTASKIRYWKSGYIGPSMQTNMLAASQTSTVTSAISPFIPTKLLYQGQYSKEYKIGHREWNPVYSDPKYRICGYEVQAYRGDNGSWSMPKGGLREDNINFHFCSCYDRGMHWGIRVWGVPREKVLFDEDEL